MFSVLSHQGNAKQNDPGIPSHTHQKIKNSRDMVDYGGKIEQGEHSSCSQAGTPSGRIRIPTHLQNLLLMGGQTYTDTLEINLVVSQKIQNSATQL